MTKPQNGDILRIEVFRNTSETVKIYTREGIKAIVFDMYFKVSAVAEYSSSEDSGYREGYQNDNRRESAMGFGNVFQRACEELKQTAGSTHLSGS